MYLSDKTFFESILESQTKLDIFSIFHTKSRFWPNFDCIFSESGSTIDVESASIYKPEHLAFVRKYPILLELISAELSSIV